MRIFRFLPFINLLLILAAFSLLSGCLLVHQYVIAFERFHARWLADPKTSEEFSEGGVQTIEVLLEFGSYFALIAAGGFGILTTWLVVLQFTFSKKTTVETDKDNN